MKARRVAIMLGIVAISALTLFLITLMDSEARGETTTVLAAVPDTLGHYEETIIIGPDGNSSVEITVVIGKGGPGDLLPPFDFDVSDDSNILSGPAHFRTDGSGIAVPVVPVLGRNMLNLEIEYDAKKDPRPPFHVGNRGDRVQAGITALCLIFYRDVLIPKETE